VRVYTAIRLKQARVERCGGFWWVQNGKRWTHPSTTRCVCVDH